MDLCEDGEGLFFYYYYFNFTRSGFLSTTFESDLYYSSVTGLGTAIFITIFPHIRITRKVTKKSQGNCVMTTKTNQIFHHRASAIFF